MVIPGSRRTLAFIVLLRRGATWLLEPEKLLPLDGALRRPLPLLPAALAGGAELVAERGDDAPVGTRRAVVLERKKPALEEELVGRDHRLGSGGGAGMRAVGLSTTNGWAAAAEARVVRVNDPDLISFASSVPSRKNLHALPIRTVSPVNRKKKPLPDLTHDSAEERNCFLPSAATDRVITISERGRAGYDHVMSLPLVPRWNF
ncbi:hypothetical protein MUK42_22834 [Musa troglodytarum]|uniref:Uncharacterized protein n=1 Tax=Musa troglodytarum TaxID=320322 RepID=A0A9E7KD34_9LILI|nr:hypothetical protein MUK42_22834 [Musa troglodytarum]